MQVIVYKRPDGGVSIVTPARPVNETDNLRGRRDVPDDALNVGVCDSSDIPVDRTYRNAWERGGARNPVKVSMSKAKALHRNRLREARREKFTDLDGKWMKAIAANDTAEAGRCEAQRQILRDLPQNPAIDIATKPEQLKALWPPELS